MKKIILHIILLFGLSLNLSAQVNLVPNPSFEDSLGCPLGFGQISLTNYWYSPNLATPDYFHECSIAYGVPINVYGYQPARTGIAYAGAIMTGGYREYISSRLSNPLVRDKNYCVEFFVNMASVSFPMPSDTVSLGVYLSNDSVFNSTAGILPYSPQILNALGQNVHDTANWTRISGIYKALGGEQYITIGNFYADEFFFGSNYYYVDDVSIIECNTEIVIPNVFTPNNDGINDIFEIKNLPENTLTQIYNRWGIKVFETNKSAVFWDGRTTSGIDSVDGTYFYIITTEEEIYKGFLQVIK